MIERPSRGLRMAMRRAVLGAVLALAISAVSVMAQGSGVAGTWEMSAPNGTKVTLVLRQEGRRVVGTLSGNGSRFEVEGELDGDGMMLGTARSQAGSLFIGAERAGEQLGVAIAEMTAAGLPDMTRAQEMRMQRASAATADAGAAGSASSSGKPGAGRPNVGGSPGAGNNAAPNARSSASPADQQLSQLLLSSPWCYMRYSQQMGATTTERVVYSADGRVVSRTQRESSVNNNQGSYYGNSTGGEQGFWRVQNGSLMLSEDGQNFVPIQMTVSRNSNGYPIVTAAGKEYYQCN